MAAEPPMVVPSVDLGRPVSYRTKSDAAYAELRRRIVHGVLAPMTQLNQEELARSLGVSTTPLREALRRLEAEGLMVISAHRDAMVAPLNVDLLPDLYDTKVAMECYACALAGERATDEDKRAIQQTIDRLLDAQAAPDDVWHANREMHSLIYRASHNATLIDCLDLIWDRFERYRHLLHEVILDPAIEREHKAIVDAIVEGRGEDAAEAMRAHSAHGRAAIESNTDAPPPVRLPSG